MNMQVRSSSGGGNEAVMLLRAILAKQDEQNALLQALVKKQHENTRNAAAWKNQHPELSQRCTDAAAKAARLMDGMIARLVDDLDDFEDESWDGGQFELDELINKYGYKFQQFSMLMQTLAQLGNQ